MQVIWPTMGLAGSGFAVQSSATAVFSSPAAVAGTQTTVNPTEATLIDASAAPATTYYRIVYTFPNSTVETSSTCQPVSHASGRALLTLSHRNIDAHQASGDLSVCCPMVYVLCAQHNLGLAETVACSVQLSCLELPA